MNKPTSKKQEDAITHTYIHKKGAFREWEGAYGNYKYGNRG